jgi:hypothetical protein
VKEIMQGGLCSFSIQKNRSIFKQLAASIISFHGILIIETRNVASVAATCKYFFPKNTIASKLKQ